MTGIFLLFIDGKTWQKQEISFFGGPAHSLRRFRRSMHS
jgi:hypothetical protein